MKKILPIVSALCVSLFSFSIFLKFYYWESNGYIFNVVDLSGTILSMIFTFIFIDLCVKLILK